MPLAEQITQDMKDAMRARDSLRLETVRMLRGEIRNREIELGQVTLDDAGIEQVIRGLIKQRRESREAYVAAGRTELAEREAAEIEILSAYLPPELDDAALHAIVDEVLAAWPADRPRQAGPIVGQVMGRLAGRADGKRVSAAVQARLEG